MASRDSFFERAASGLPAPSTEGGKSGYFSRPEDTLDPALFDGERLRPEVRHHVIGHLWRALEQMGLMVEDPWLHVWITGSSISYQWSADRGNGDLDVLFSIDLAPFTQENNLNLGEEEIAAAITDGLKQTLWPSDSAVQFGDRQFEVTYFWNAGTGSDIRSLNPYAAYDVVKDKWVTRPPELPEDPGSLYPESWYESTKTHAETARRLTERFQEHMGKLRSLPPNSPGWHDSGAALNMITEQATGMFTELHTARQAAFSGGKGYGDYANFLWQVGKQNGTTQALHEIMEVGKQARADQEAQQFGAPIDAADVALRRAAAQYRNLG